MAFGDMEDVWHASVGAAKLRNARNAKIAGQAAARSEQRRASTVSTNVLNFKATRKNRFPKPTRPSLLGDQQRFGNGSIVGKRWEGEVSKGVMRQSVAPTQARVNPTATMKPRIPLVAKPVTRAVIGKAGIFETARLVPKALKGGWKVGTGSKLKAGLKDTATLNSSRTLQHVGGASKWAAQNRGAAGLSAGVVGGSIIGAGLAHRDVEKAHGELPEDSRYYRLGMGSAALGAGGVGGLEYARRDVKRSTRLARGGSPMAVQNLKHGKVQLVAFESEPGKKVTGRILNPKCWPPASGWLATATASPGVALQSARADWRHSVAQQQCTSGPTSGGTTDARIRTARRELLDRCDGDPAQPAGSRPDQQPARAHRLLRRQVARCRPEVQSGRELLARGQDGAGAQAGRQVRVR
jgi:hypothetical protein